MADVLCESCLYFAYDEELEDDVCTMDLDEDEVQKFLSSHYQRCPYYRMGDDYTIVKKQN